MKLNKNFLFIHIPKSAGVSVQKSGLIKSEDWQNHKPAKQIENLDNYFSFAFIRNPYEKVLSSYFFYFKKSKHDYFKNFFLKYPDFEKFVIDFANSNTLNDFHFRMCSYDFVSSDSGEILVDYLGRFETLNEDFEKIQTLNGVQKNNLIKLNFHNVSLHEDWRIYYTVQMSEIIYYYFKKDFEYFDIDRNSYKKN